MKIAERKPASKVLDSTTLSDNIYTIYITLTQKLIDNPTFWTYSRYIEIKLYDVFTFGSLILYIFLKV